ncbi:TetR family transcriptional regulator [Tsuneonella sp. HG222]
MAEQALNQDMIVREALKVLQEDGLEGVTFRKLGKRLGIKGPSLYWHIAHKEFLLGRMTRSIMNDCLAKVKGADTWQEWLYSFGFELWHAQLTIRDCAAVLLQAKWEEEWLTELHSHLTEQLHERGLPRDKAMVMHSAVQSLVTGWAAFATGPNAQFVDAHLRSGVEDALLQSLRALIRGCETEVAANSTG